jgi:hypothetical protein
MTRDALDVVVEIEAPQELNNSSYVLAGLFDLEHAGIIREVRIVPSLDLHRGEIHVASDGRLQHSSFRAYHTSFLTLRASGRAIRLAIDMRDATNIFPEDGLRHADIVFKRSFDDEFVDIVARRFPVAIEPAGLSFCVRSPHEHEERMLVAWSLLATMRNATILDRSLLSRWRREWRKARAHVALFGHQHPRTATLLRSAPDNAHPTVFYQTRTFNRTDDADLNEIHADRAMLIRALRKEFGAQFIGGFVPDALSIAQFPDCLTTVPSEKVSYLTAMRRATVVVYTRGILQSAAWKLAEYLALGKCIVAERVSGRLPAPLLDGSAVAEFRSVDECVEKCRLLLASPTARQTMEDAARAYYDEWVDPSAGMHRMLITAMRLNGARSAAR